MKWNRFSAVFSALLMLVLLAGSAAAAQMRGAVSILPDEQKILSMDESDEVWVCIQAEEGDAFYRADFKNEEINAKLTMELLNEDGLLLAKESAYTGRKSYLSFRAESGKTYYLKFSRQFSNADGRFTVSVKRSPDAHGDDTAHASVIEAGQTVIASFDGTGDQDYLSVTTQADGAFYRAELQNESVDTTAYMEILDHNGLKLLRKSAYPGHNGVIDFRADSGERYYLRLYRSNEYIDGTYTVKFTCMPDLGSADMDDAYALSAGESAACGLEIDDDEDYFLFPAADAAVKVVNASSSYLRACLMDANGQEITQNVAVNKGDYVILTADRSPAYLRIKGKSGGYTVECCTQEKHVENGKWMQVREAACGQEGLEEMMCTVCGKAAQTRATPALEHEISETYRTEKAAGCDDAGLEVRTCLRCGEILEERATAATGHLHTGWHIAAEPTCEAEGLQYRICLDCGKRFEHERIAPYGHILGENGYSIAATCTENGIAVRNCRLCSAKMEETILPAPGHDFSDWMETKAPTVSEEGSEKRICAVCGHVESRAIEKKRLFDGMFGK